MVIGVLTNSRVVKGGGNSEHNGMSGYWFTQCGHHLSLIRRHLSRDFKGRASQVEEKKTNLMKMVFSEFSGDMVIFISIVGLCYDVDDCIQPVS